MVGQCAIYTYSHIPLGALSRKAVPQLPPLISIETRHSGISLAETSIAQGIERHIYLGMGMYIADGQAVRRSITKQFKLFYQTFIFQRVTVPPVKRHIAVRYACDFDWMLTSLFHCHALL